MCNNKGRSLLWGVVMITVAGIATIFDFNDAHSWMLVAAVLAFAVGDMKRCAKGC